MSTRPWSGNLMDAIYEFISQIRLLCLTFVHSDVVPLFNSNLVRCLNRNLFNLQSQGNGKGCELIQMEREDTA